MAVGGKTDKLHGTPVRIRGRVKSLHEGEYVETEVRHGGGRYWDMGHTAVIEVEGFDSGSAEPFARHRAAFEPQQPPSTDQLWRLPAAPEDPGRQRRHRTTSRL